MKKLAILVITTLACAGIEKRDRVLKQFDRFLGNGIFQVLVECQTTLPDGKIKIERGLGNAFLVGENTLASAAHLFQNTTEKKCTVVARNHQTRDTEVRIRVLDPASDVAILEAEVGGRPFSLREHTTRDDIVYVSGYWFYRHKDKIHSVPYIVQATINKDDSLKNDPMIPLLGMFAHGMSGSPIITPDGQIVGIFAKVHAHKSPAAIGKAVMAKYIISSLNFYKKHMKKIGGENEK